MPTMQIFYADTVDVFSPSTLANLPIGATRRGLVVDSTVMSFLDARVFLRSRVAGTPVGGASVDLWLATSVDGVNYTDGYSGSALETTELGTPAYSSPLVSIPVPSSSNVIFSWEGSILDYINSMPKYWAIVINNRTGVALHSSSAEHILKMSGVHFSYA